MEHLEELKTVLYEHFGEDRVDIVINDTSEDNYILIYYPEVIISNENNTQHTIKDLYVKIFLTDSLCIMNSLQGTRTTFTSNEIKANYIHSHLPKSYNNIDFREFCLGVGPINMTLCTLKNSFDINIWKLLCTELDIFVRTESLQGGPYIKISEIGSNRDTGTYYPKNFFNVGINLERIILQYDIKNRIKDFKRILEAIKENHYDIFNWVLVDNLIVPGRNFIDIIRKLTTIVLLLMKSNTIEFISYYFEKVEYRDGKVVIISDNSTNDSIHFEPFRFKNNIKDLHIIEEIEEPSSNILLSPNLGMFLIDIIAKAVNINNIANGKVNIYYC